MNFASRRMPPLLAVISVLGAIASPVHAQLTEAVDGKLYYNEFTTTDDTLKLGGGAWSLDTASGFLRWISAAGEGLAYVDRSLSEE